LKISLMLGACLIAGVGVASVAAGSHGGSSRTPVVSLSSTSVTFANQLLETTSSPRTVTLTNAGKGLLENLKVSITGNFAETNNCPTNLNPLAECSINVTFMPAAVGSLHGSISIKDNASGSPQSVSLSGTGTTSGGGGGGGGVGCGGTPITQVQTNVTSFLSYANVAAGVSVTQLTDNGSSRFYYFDVPAYSPAVNGIAYVNSVAGNEVVTSTPSGTGAQIISPTKIGTQLLLSGDGELAYYPKGIPSGPSNGTDLFGIFLNSSGMCQEMRFTNLDLPPLPPLGVWEVSGASPDPAGGYDIAFSPDLLLHRIHVLANGTSQALPTITLNDPESLDTFHRIRLNPKFPNIVMYKRNEALVSNAQPEVWLVDLNTCANGTCAASNIVNVVQNLEVPPGHQPKGGHVNWSPDGLDIAFSEPDIADYWMARNVVNSNGTINTSFTLQELGPFSTQSQPSMTADYCVFPPNWPTATVLACLAGPASSANAKRLYLMSSDGMGTTKLLAATDAQVLSIYGTPMPEFAQDGQHLMFNSDRTGVPQIYLVSGFTLTVP
jgi:hypothetical protein